MTHGLEKHSDLGRDGAGRWVAAPEARSAVVCAGLTYRFGAHTAVDHVDLRIEPGRDVRPARPERGGQDHDDPGDHHAAAPMAGMVAVFGINAAAEPMAVRRTLGYVPQQLSADGDADRPGERRAVRPAVRRAAAAAGRAGAPRRWPRWA